MAQHNETLKALKALYHDVIALVEDETLPSSAIEHPTMVRAKRAIEAEENMPLTLACNPWAYRKGQRIEHELCSGCSCQCHDGGLI